MKKILIIRFSSIGDIVLTTPIVRCIKKTYPESALHYATKKEYYSLLQHNPNIDKIHLLDKNLIKLTHELRAENFDYIIDLHNNIRSNRITIALNKKSAHVQKHNIGKWLLVNTKTNIFPTVHIVDRYFDTANLLEIKNDLQGLDYYPSSNTSFEKIQQKIPINKPYIAWVIGGKHFTKIFPAEKIINICKQLETPVIILGDKTDKYRGDEIKSALPSVYNAAGSLSLDESAIVVKNASLVVTNDTGLMHIATAFQKKIISLWGSTVKEFGMFPYMPQAKFDYRIIDAKDIPCRPCSKIGFKTCPKKHFKCMLEISETEILAAIRNFLNT